MSCHAGPARHLAHFPNTKTSPSRTGKPSVDRLSVRHQLHTHYHSTDIVSAWTTYLPHATLDRNSSPSALDKRATRPFSLFCNRRGGKRKPPPMHQMRRLREPGKIHQRRRNCSARAVTLLLRLSVKFLRLSSDASHVRRDGGALGDRALPFPAREICFVR